MIIIAILAVLTAILAHFWVKERKARIQDQKNTSYPDDWTLNEMGFFWIGAASFAALVLTTSMYLNSMTGVKLINEQCGGKQFTASEYFYLRSEVQEYCMREYYSK